MNESNGQPEKRQSSLPWPGEVNGALFVVPGRAGSNFSFMGQQGKALGDSIKATRSHNLITIFQELALQSPNSQAQIFPVNQEEKIARNKKVKYKVYGKTWWGRRTISFKSSLKTAHACTRTHTHTHTHTHKMSIEHLGLVEQFTAARRIRSTRPNVLITWLLFSRYVQLFWDSMDSQASLARESQVTILEWVAISCSRGSPQAQDWTRVTSIGRQILYLERIGL